MPWLWFLTRTADCRVFQNMTVPDLVMTVFREHGLTDFDDALTETYPEREYCVQYRETDFAFVSRLLEEEGVVFDLRGKVDLRRFRWRPRDGLREPA